MEKEDKANVVVFMALLSLSVASGPTVTSSGFLRRFRLFLGQLSSYADLAESTVYPVYIIHRNDLLHGHDLCRLIFVVSHLGPLRRPPSKLYC